MKTVEVEVSRKNIIIIVKRQFLISIRNYRCIISIFSPTSSWVGRPLGSVLVEQTAALVVASVSSCNMALFAVVAGFRRMGITNVIAMGPAIVVVEAVVLFWRLWCRIWIATIVVP